MCAVLAAAAAGAYAADTARPSVRPFGADRAVQIEIRYDAPDTRYTLSATGTDAVVYSVNLDDPDHAAGMLRVMVSINGRAPFPVLANAGTRYRSAADVLYEPEEIAPSAGALLAEHRIEGQAVVLRYRERPGSHLLEKTYRVPLKGMTLVVKFSSDSTGGLDGYAGVSLGRAEPAPGTRVVQLPYLPDPVALFPGGAVMTAYVDPMATSSVRIASPAGGCWNGCVFETARPP